MLINLDNIIRGQENTGDDKVRPLSSKFDCPTLSSFAHILKSLDKLIVDRAVKAFSGNSAYSTRLIGIKLT